MGLPHKLKDMNLFDNGFSYLGLVPEVTLPKITLKTEAYRGGGMLAEVDVAMGLEKLEMEIKYGGAVRNKLRSLGLAGVNGSLMRWLGAYQEDATGAVLAAEVVAQGLLTELDPGSAKVGDNTEWTAKHTLIYYKLVIGGVEEIEIDVLNNVWRVGVVDRMADIRAALQQ